MITIYTRLTVENAWTDITNEDDIKTLSKKYNVAVLNAIQFSVIQADNFNKGSMVSTCLQFGFYGNDYGYSKINGFIVIGTNAGGVSVAYKVMFRQSGNKYQYYRMRWY